MFFLAAAKLAAITIPETAKISQLSLPQKTVLIPKPSNRLPDALFYLATTKNAHVCHNLSFPLVRPLKYLVRLNVTANLRNVYVRRLSL